MRPFRLVPFSPDALVSGLVLSGTVDRDGSVLRADYSLTGELSAVVVPGPAATLTPQDGLWKATCFELFAAPQGQASYLEVNLSPSGDWAAYSFNAYREQMTALQVVRFSPYCKSRGPAALELGFELELGPLAPLAAICDVAITAVLEHSCGTRSYWALSHTSDRPDFHKRDSFILRI